MFDCHALGAAIAAHGPVARVVVAEVAGSAPREVGAAMLVWAGGQSGGQSGTIGGGALEWQAARQARTLLPQSVPRVERLPLGPSLGQCCGGVVTLVTETYTTVPAGPVIARPLDGSPMPLAVKRLLAAARGQGVMPQARLIQGWMVEPVADPVVDVWVWGAGHVGRAVMATLAPLPRLALTWVDVAADRFPEVSGLRVLPAADPIRAVPLAPRQAHHLIVTYSHALDLDLCHGLLSHGFATCGLIGSATKWARFRARLAALGHSPDAIGRIQCPIGDPALGKHPQAIAISVAHDMLQQIGSVPLIGGQRSSSGVRP